MKHLALVVSSEIRIAILKSLNPDPHSYTDLKNSVDCELKRTVSPGSFGWHLEKLKGAGIIEKTSVDETSNHWQLTKRGKAIRRAVRDINLEIS